MSIRTASSLLGLSLLLLAGPVLAGPYDEHNSNDATLSRIKWFSLRQTGKPAEIHVRASGDSYDTADAQSVAFNYETKAECRGVWDLHWLKVELDDEQHSAVNEPNKDSGIEAKTFISYNHDSGDRTRSESGSFGSIVPNPKIAKYAYQRCNDSVKARVAKGMTREAALNQEVRLGYQDEKHPPFFLDGWMLCGAADNGYHFDHAWQYVKIDVICESKPLPPTPPGTVPADTHPPVKKLVVPIKVTKTELALSPAKHTGACPVEMKLLGKIYSDRAGTVEYRWENDKGAKSQTYSQVFGAKDLRNVSTTVKIGKAVKDTIGDLKQPGSLDDDGDAADDLYKGKFKLVIVSEVTNEDARVADAGYEVQCLAGKPDLRPGPIVNVGGKGVTAGGVLALGTGEIDGTIDGDCLFKYSYDQTNASAFPATGYVNMLRAETTGDQSLVQSLGANQSKKVYGTLRLTEGSHEIKLKLDSGEKIDETNEGNNELKFRARVTGCSTLKPG